MHRRLFLSFTKAHVSNHGNLSLPFCSFDCILHVVVDLVYVRYFCQKSVRIGNVETLIRLPKCPELVPRKYCLFLVI